MKNNKPDHLLFVEPVNAPSSTPVEDEITKAVEAAWGARRESDYGYRGVHSCTAPGCAVHSDNRDHWITLGGVEYMTNSLCAHYLRHHRAEVPQRDLDIIRASLGPTLPAPGEPDPKHVGLFLGTDYGVRFFAGPTDEGFVAVLDDGRHSGTCSSREEAADRAGLIARGIRPNTEMPRGQCNRREMTSALAWIVVNDVATGAVFGTVRVMMAQALIAGPHTAEWYCASAVVADLYRLYGREVIEAVKP